MKVARNKKTKELVLYITCDVFLKQSDTGYENCQVLFLENHAWVTMKREDFFKQYDIVNITAAEAFKDASEIEQDYTLNGINHYARFMLRDLRSISKIYRYDFIEGHGNCGNKIVIELKDMHYNPITSEFSFNSEKERDAEYDKLYAAWKAYNTEYEGLT